MMQFHVFVNLIEVDSWSVGGLRKQIEVFLGSILRDMYNLLSKININQCLQ